MKKDMASKEATYHAARAEAQRQANASHEKEQTMIAINGTGEASKILSTVALAASTTRPHLNAVLVRVRSNVLDVVATNGHMIAHYAAKLECEDCEVLIPLATVEKIAKASRKAMGVSIDPNACSAKVYDGASSVFEWTKVATPFPPFEQVTPECGIVPDAKLEGFAIAPEYLVLAGKMFGLLAKDKKRPDGVYLELPKDDRSPIVCSSASVPELVLVVMPIRETRGPSRQSGHGPMGGPLANGRQT